MGDRPAVAAHFPVDNPDFVGCGGEIHDIRNFREVCDVTDPGGAELERIEIEVELGKHGIGQSLNCLLAADLRLRN